jgi:RNA-directed DNA polymerase
MAAAQTARTMSPGLLKVVERARRSPDAQFHSLAHLIDEEALHRAFQRLRKDAAVGVDGITKEQYGQELETRLQALVARLKAGQYRHQPIRRVHIPKAPGRTRPIGISTIEDKLVQSAITEILEAIYEQDFLPCSFGFRPGRSAHDALRALRASIQNNEANWLLEADIESFFDSVDRAALSEMLWERVADGSLLRLIGKCLHVGVLDGAEYAEPDQGTAQGSILSPLLGNLYLHHALDRWFEAQVQPRLQGKAQLIRYADDFVITFEHQGDAERVFAVLPQRMARYGLKLNPEKTRLLPMHRPTGRGGGGSATFDFLGFTVFWRRAHSGSNWRVGMTTRKARMHRAIKALQEFCRAHRHDSLAKQRAGLARRLEGHFNYFGMQGNFSAVARVLEAAKQAWFKWLNRRSQQSRLTWTRYNALLREFPLPRASIRVPLWGSS